MQWVTLTLFQISALKVNTIRKQYRVFSSVILASMKNDLIYRLFSRAINGVPTPTLTLQLMSWRMERTMFCLPTIYPGCTPIVLYSHCYCCVQYLYLQLTIVLETPLTIRSASGLCDHEFTRLIIFCTIPHIIYYCSSSPTFHCS